MSAAVTPAVDPTNVEQAKAWDGDEGAYWATHADVFDRSVAGYHAAFLDAADIARRGPGARHRVRHRADDPGRGPGGRDPAAALGVDLSARMIERRPRRRRPRGPRQRRLRARRRPDPPLHGRRFDVAISRTGAMFFGDPVAAFTTSPGPCAPAAGCGSSSGRAPRPTSGSASCRRPWPPAATCRATSLGPGTVLARRSGPGTDTPRQRRLHRHPARSARVRACGSVTTSGRGRAVHPRPARLDAAGPR